MKSFWINLPVKDIEKSRDFYKKIGFSENPMHQNSTESASFYIGEHKIVMMLFPEKQFESFTRNKIPNTSVETEILLSIDAASKEEVDQMAKTVLDAGGSIYAEANLIQEWMYGLGFMDLDGHRWNMLFIDEEKMSKN